QFSLGLIYFEGRDDIPKDYNEALKWFRMAADQGDAHAQYHIGIMYHKGHGVTYDINEAMKWYRMAADNEEMHAQFTLGTIYEEGDGVPKDIDEARIMYRRAL